VSDTYRKDPGTVSQLTPEQYEVTQQCGTSRPSTNEFWDNKEPGIYVDVVSGEPLFASVNKYDSGTGWPSFTVPIEPGNVVERKDRTLWMTRTRSVRLTATATWAMSSGRAGEAEACVYCINSAALRFIPLDDLESEGYGDYRKLFETAETRSAS